MLAEIALIEVWYACRAFAAHKPPPYISCFSTSHLPPSRHQALLGPANAIEQISLDILTRVPLGKAK